MDKTRCYIMGAGECAARILPADGDYVIAADGGYAALMALSITPDLVVGDFDSLGDAPAHPNVLRCNKIKDDTDMMLAVKQGLKLGFDNFLLNGGLGGRLDHTFANIQTLAYLAERGAFGILAGCKMNIAVIKNAKLTLALQDIGKPAPTTQNDGLTLTSPPSSCDSDFGGSGKTVSVFSYGGSAEGITLEGFKYPLKDAVVSDSFPVGVSNELVADIATIEVKNGMLLVMASCSILIAAG